MKNNENLNGACNDTKMKEQENASVFNGVISQHINRLHQKAQLANSQQKTNNTTSSDSKTQCASSHTNLSSSAITSDQLPNLPSFHRLRCVAALVSWEVAIMNIYITSRQ